MQKQPDIEMQNSTSQDFSALIQSIVEYYESYNGVGRVFMEFDEDMDSEINDPAESWKRALSSNKEFSSKEPADMKEKSFPFIPKKIHKEIEKAFIGQIRKFQ